MPSPKIPPDVEAYPEDVEHGAELARILHQIEDELRTEDEPGEVGDPPPTA